MTAAADGKRYAQNCHVLGESPRRGHVERIALAHYDTPEESNAFVAAYFAERLRLATEGA